MDITLSVLSYVKGHILQLIFDIVGFAFIFTIMSAFLFWFCNKKGWTKINEKGPRWFIIIFALVSLTAGVSIGGVVGFKTGVLNITEKITDDSGRVIVEQGFVKAANFIGIDIHQKINIKSAKLFLNKLHKIKLLESDGWIGVSLNNYMHSMLLNPFVSNTNTYIDTLAPGSEIVPVQVIYSTWDDFNTKMKKETENKKNIWRISGLIALVLWILVPVSIVSTIRVLKNKVKGDTVKSEDAKESDCLSVKEAEQQINVVPFKETTDTKPDQIVMVEKSIFSNYKVWPMIDKGRTGRITYSINL